MSTVSDWRTFGILFSHNNRYLEDGSGLDLRTAHIVSKVGRGHGDTYHLLGGGNDLVVAVHDGSEALFYSFPTFGAVSEEDGTREQREGTHGCRIRRRQSGRAGINREASEGESSGLGRGWDVLCPEQSWSRCGGP